jgi:catechol 2,3-dioxygenase-like lactoylglutathione lyase family enzyme
MVLSNAAIPRKPFEFMKSRFIDHIDLRVTDLREADAFYSLILPAVGFPNRIVLANCICFDSDRGHPKPEFIALIEEKSHVPNQTRIAFWCDTKREVDEFVPVLVRASARKVEGPMFNPEYSSTYYAVFFEDLCGNRLEVCCRIAESSRG